MGKRIEGMEKKIESLGGLLSSRGLWDALIKSLVAEENNVPNDEAPNYKAVLKKMQSGTFTFNKEEGQYLTATLKAFYEKNRAYTTLEPVLGELEEAFPIN